uniref:Uncharacterized protein n=2 Tax=Rhizophagus irregularis TaxID=588596 RepID=U9TXU5_RHIID
MNEVRRHSVYFVDQMEAIGPLYDMIQKGEFVASYGARASGKSTRVDQAMFELERRGMSKYENYKHILVRWSAIVINAPKYFKLYDVKSADDFMSKFQKSNWKSDVLFINEYDTSLVADDDVKTSFLGAIRNIKNSKRHYALWSAVVIGPLSILFLKSDKMNISPLNVKEPFRNPNFTLAQVES